MKKFLYLSLVCAVIAGLGLFFGMPKYPTPVIPFIIALIGLILAISTLKDKDISVGLKIGGILVNLMPCLAGLSLIV
ncbi:MULTISPECIES: hypothetical protein [Mammaliicoccus]|uniref:Uncharacterized protein n=1 Tax=Mammaliicoccus sciuri TaxID=1296 RepID=A0AAW5LNF0_MAMSC|nr:MULTISPECIES: hypothetical protein [Mammaliicoccus]KTT82868.1 membrane protein [Mammaliicoccus sciuri]MBF0774771.1 hypothetical protein [Mammaliicoccus sciuri]MBG9206286.1 hypothetical protein [Mammaliicoccus sciuri]MBG9210723.1 hypothetical protein [Mammaliicoccus sciuri]MBO1207846.1 hypothetical protein [Mammaliicoccus sciuri]